MLSDEQRRQLADEGYCIVPSAMAPDVLERARAALDVAAEEQRAKGAAHDARLDPNDANIRLYNLPSIDPIFIDLLRDDAAMAAVHELLGPGVLVSNFTANIALPGSGSMNIHSDQALVVPSPWFEPWACNVIWCLDDVHDANGTTRYLPGSHRYKSAAEVPADAMERTLPFEASAGSFIVMEGRLWHTSGRNVTSDERRRMMFAYYSTDFIRQQANWAFQLPAAVMEAMDAPTRKLFGLEAMGNVRIGGSLTRRKQAEPA